MALAAMMSTAMASKRFRSGGLFNVRGTAG
jgi:hypothetical protein